MQRLSTGAGDLLHLLTAPRVTDSLGYVRKEREVTGNLQELFAPDVGKGSEGGWREVEASRFAVRGPNYLRDKRKVQSSRALFEAVAVDAYQSKQMEEVRAARSVSE